jgi:hypothetical protein
MIVWMRRPPAVSRSIVVATGAWRAFPRRVAAGDRRSRARALFVCGGVRRGARRRGGRRPPGRDGPPGQCLAGRHQLAADGSDAERRALYVPQGFAGFSRPPTETADPKNRRPTRQAGPQIVSTDASPLATSTHGQHAKATSRLSVGCDATSGVSIGTIAGFTVPVPRQLLG